MGPCKALPKGPTVDPPSWEMVMNFAKEYLEGRPGKCDEEWQGWMQIHSLMAARGMADNSAECVIAVQHWVEELIRLRILEFADSGGLRIREVVNRPGWHIPPPKPKPLPKRRGQKRSRGGGATGR